MRLPALPGEAEILNAIYAGLALGAALGAGPTLSAATTRRSVGANDRIRIGIIGCGERGRTAHMEGIYKHLAATNFEIVAVCDANPAMAGWFQTHCPTVRQATADYRELLRDPEVEAVYVAVPHNLHAEIYCAAIAAGKHLMGEKPFGIAGP